MTRTTLYVDIETHSATELKDSGVYRYVEDPTFLILMAAWAVDDGPVTVETTPAGIMAIPGLWDDDVLKVAHNAAFERVCFSRFKGMPTGEYLSPLRYHDTQAVAAELGYPQKLETLAARLGAAPKDAAGTRLINLFSKPNRAGGRTTAEDKPVEWAEFVEYCRQDVATLREVHKALGGFPTKMEQRVYWVDQIINDRGIRVDVDLARNAEAAAEENAIIQELEFMRLTGVDNPNSHPQVTAWVKRAGLGLPNLQSKTIDAALERDGLSPDHRRVLELRQELALVASAKYRAALNSVCSDRRFRGGFRFHGAHTGRWAGRGVQLHNLPRATLESDTAVSAAILDLSLGWGADPYTLKALLRPMLLGPFTVVDYAAIEARVLAWLAGEDWALEAFAAGRDIYVETAERMSTPTNPLTRSHGKVAVLALGYNGGPNSLRAMGAKGTDEELVALVRQWRAANPNIVNLWRSVDSAFKGGGVAGRLEFKWIGRDRHMVLPSGRSMVYRNVKPNETFYFTDDDGVKQKKTSARFDNPAKPGTRASTYGGKLVENATQAVARDLLAEALVRLAKAGWPVVGHVHDEILVERVSETSLAEVKALMVQAPVWAAGLPLDGAGFLTNRFKKD